MRWYGEAEQISIKVMRVLMEQKGRKKKTKRFVEKRMNLLLFREAYIEETGGGGRWLGWRRGKSDRLDYESTHRRTLFNVSLTFLLSISSPPTPSHWKRTGREEKPGEARGKRVWEEAQRSVCTSLKVTSPRQSQGSGFTGGPANQEVGKCASEIRFHCQGVPPP